MTKKNFQEAIDRLLAQNPFRPFTVEMTNGSRYEVDHDRAIATRDGNSAVRDARRHTGLVRLPKRDRDRG